jgi:hypothetical protein
VAAALIGKYPVPRHNAAVSAAVTPEAARYRALVAATAALLAERLQAGEYALAVEHRLGLCDLAAGSGLVAARRLGLQVVHRTGTLHDPASGQRLEPLATPHRWLELRGAGRLVLEILDPSDRPGWIVIATSQDALGAEYRRAGVF